MDINSLSSNSQASAAAPGTSTAHAAALRVFRQAIDSQAQNATQLIQAAQASAPPADLDSNLGRHINVKA